LNYYKYLLRNSKTKFSQKTLRSTIDHWKETENLLGVSSVITEIRNIVAGNAKSRRSPEKVVFNTVEANSENDYSVNKDKLLEEFISTIMTDNFNTGDDDYMRGIITVINTYNNESKDEDNLREKSIAKGRRKTEIKKG
jgi:hypothetical protein